LAELCAQVREILRVQAVIRVEVRDDRRGGVEPHLVARLTQHRPPVGHCCRFSKDHAGQQRIDNVEEESELRAELFAKTAHILDTTVIGFTGDDGADTQLRRVVL
jgi:hypothetical protein